MSLAIFWYAICGICADTLLCYLKVASACHRGKRGSLEGKGGTSDRAGSGRYFDLETSGRNAVGILPGGAGSLPSGFRDACSA